MVSGCHPYGGVQFDVRNEHKPYGRLSQANRGTSGRSLCPLSCDMKVTPAVPGFSSWAPSGVIGKAGTAPDKFVLSSRVSHLQGLGRL